MTSGKSSDKLTWKSTICGICPAGCWVRAGMKDGRLVEIEAEKGHPLGMICRRGEHAPEIVYSKNRLQYPMKRTGEKGKAQFERISWGDAYEIIVNNLNKIKNESVYDVNNVKVKTKITGKNGAVSDTINNIKKLKAGHEVNLYDYLPNIGIKKWDVDISCDEMNLV